MKTYCVEEREYNQFLTQLDSQHRISSLRDYLIRRCLVEEGTEINLGALSPANCHVFNADFSYVSFFAGNLKGTYFLNTDLSFANFQNTILRHASFEGSNLIGANFTGTTFEHTNFKGAILIDAIGLPEEIAAEAKKEGAVTTIEELLDAAKKGNISLERAHSIAKQFITLAQMQDNTTQKNRYQEYVEIILHTVKTPQGETLYSRATYGFLTKLGLPPEVCHLVLNNVPYEHLGNAASVSSVYEGIGKPEGQSWTDYAILTREKFKEVKDSPEEGKKAVQQSLMERIEEERQEKEKKAHTVA